MDFGRRKARLGDILVQKRIINSNQLANALALQKGSGKKLGEILVENGLASEDGIAQALSQQLGFPMEDMQNLAVSDEILGLIKADILKKYKVFPLEFHPEKPNILRLAMADPMDMDAMDDIAIIANCQVEPYVATTRNIMLAIDKFYGSDEMDDALQQYVKDKGFDEGDLEDADLNDINGSPIVTLVREMIEKAVRQRASDIHIEPTERKLRIRYRIDGDLYERARYDIKVLASIAARIKVVGGMDIAERRKPQDGRISQIVDRLEYDIRVSILPTVYGEKIVMRLTSKTALTREKSQLGLKPRELQQFDHILKNPHGIILVTGPTGSGKSTTLYTALSELNTEDVNIITVEDPVEANIDGINQVQVNVKAELTFASALRSILRQDPDIIMIGEIRDTETASIAVQASITGHLVVSTLHTNSSASTITRLEDMGIESYLIADSVVGVIAQRLVRRLCPKCKRQVMATMEQKEYMGVDVNSEVPIFAPAGCSHCDHTGYKGRIGVYEIMRMTPRLRQIVSKQEGVEAIREQAIADGMYTLRMSAAEYVLDGTTSYDEMMRVSFES